jgi:hypothetical protein
MSTLTISPLTVRPATPRSTPLATRRSTPARPPARLTRRGRLVTTLVLVAAATGVLGLVQPEALALGRGGGPVAERITVRPGETLWAIADRVAPDADPRSTIATIEDMNDLDSSTVPAGSVLLVPARR